MNHSVQQVFLICNITPNPQSSPPPLTIFNSWYCFALIINVILICKTKTSYFVNCMTVGEIIRTIGVLFGSRPCIRYIRYGINGLSIRKTRFIISISNLKIILKCPFKTVQWLFCWVNITIRFAMQDRRITRSVKKITAHDNLTDFSSILCIK